MNLPALAQQIATDHKSGQTSLSYKLTVDSQEYDVSAEWDPEDIQLILDLDLRQRTPLLPTLLTFLNVGDFLQQWPTLLPAHGGFAVDDVKLVFNVEDAALSLIRVHLQDQSGKPFPIREGIALDGLQLMLLVTVESPAVNAVIGGTASIDGTRFAAVASIPELAFRVELAPDQHVSLSNLAAYFLGGDLALPNDFPLVTLTNASVDVDLTSKSCCLSLQMDDDWPITVGTQDLHLRLETITLGLSGNGQAAVTGEIAGSASFAGASFHAAWNYPDEVQIDGSIPALSLQTIFDKVPGEAAMFKAVVESVDVMFLDSSVYVAKQGQEYTFALGTTLAIAGKSWGTAIMDYSNRGLVLGIAPPEGWSLASLFSSLSAFDTITFSRIALVISSYTDTSFRFPTVKHFKNPKAPLQDIPLPQEVGLQEGIACYASLRLSEAGLLAPVAKALRNLNEPLQVCVAVTTNPESMTLTATLPESNGLLNPASTVTLTQPFLKFLAFAEGGVEFEVGGTFCFRVLQTDFAFSGAIAIKPGGISGSISTQTPVRNAFGIKNFTLDAATLELSIDDAGLPGFGFLGEFTAGDISGGCGFVFDSTDPTNELLLANMSAATFSQIADSFTKAAMPTALHEPLSQVSIAGTNKWTTPRSDDDITVLNRGAVPGTITQCIEPPLSSAQNLVVSRPRPDKEDLWIIVDRANHYVYEVTIDRDAFTVAQDAQLLITTTTYRIQGKISAFGNVVTGELLIDPAQGLSLNGDIEKPITIGKLLTISDATYRKGPMIDLCTYSMGTVDAHLNLSVGVTVAGAFACTGTLSASEHAFGFTQRTRVYNAFAANVTLTASLGALTGCKFSCLVELTIDSVRANVITKITRSAAAAKQLRPYLAQLKSYQAAIDADNQAIAALESQGPSPEGILKIATYKADILKNQTGMDATNVELSAIKAADELLKEANTTLIAGFTAVQTWIDGHAGAQLIEVRTASLKVDVDSLTDESITLNIDLDFMEHHLMFQMHFNPATITEQITQAMIQKITNLIATF